jgi:hypothetical protein
MLLSKQQQAAFWTLWKRAEAEDLPRDADRQQRDTWRRNVMLQACGKVSLKDVRPAGDYDRLMFAAASLAGDYQAMAYWDAAGERRTAHLIGECARQIGEIAGEPRGWEYCRGLFAQAGFPPHWMDIPGTLLQSSFQMLDTPRRRILKRDHGWRGERHGQPLGFSPARVYIRSGMTVSYYDPLPTTAAHATA